MKFNLFLFFIFLSGTYTTVLCVRNQEEQVQETLSSTGHSDHNEVQRGDGGDVERENHQETQADLQETAKVTRPEVEGQGDGHESQTSKGPDTLEQQEQLPEGAEKAVLPAEKPLETPPQERLPAVPESRPEEALKTEATRNTEAESRVDPGTSEVLSPKQDPPVPPKSAVDHPTPQENERATEQGRENLPQAEGLRQPAGPLPSRTTEQNIKPLAGPEPERTPAPQVAENTVVQLEPNPAVTTVVPVKPVLNPPTPVERPLNAKAQPGPRASGPPADASSPTGNGNTNANDNAAAGSNPPNAAPSADTDKEANVKGVLLTSLKDMQNNFDSVNTRELVHLPDSAEALKKSLCESLKNNLVNVCASTGSAASNDLLTLVNNYYRNNVCTTEHSLNQLFNRDGDFAYKLLTSHLDQFKKKAPNKSTQVVYDKSVHVVSNLADLMKQAELALVSEDVQKLLEKRNLILTSAICAVANADQNAMSSSDFSSGQVTLTLNQEDYIKETTDAFMKAYGPMVELLKQFSRLLPDLLDIYEEGFENKINMITSLAALKPKPKPAAASGDSATAAAPSGTGQTTGGPSAAAGAAVGGAARAPEAASATLSGPLAAAKANLLEFLGLDDREIAAVHGHPSLIEKFKSLLQVSTTPGPTSPKEPAPTSPKEPAPTTPKEPAPTTLREPAVTVHTETTVSHSGPDNRGAQESNNSVRSQTELPAAQLDAPNPRVPRVDVKTLDGLRVLERTTTGGVSNADHSVHQLATSATGSGAGVGAGAGTRAGVPPLANLVKGLGARAEADAEGTDAGMSGVFGKIKRKLEAMMLKRGAEVAMASAAESATEALKKVRDQEKERQLFEEAMKHFSQLGLFKTVGGKMLTELDEQKVKNLVRSNLLTLNDFDSMYNLVVGPQRSLHSLYTFMEHMLLSPEADEKIKHIEDANLAERVKKMVNPLEDLYEQIKANAPRLVLKKPDLEEATEAEASAGSPEESTEEHVDNRGKFLLMSNLSGLNLSEHNLMIKLNKLAQNLTTRSGIKGTFAQTCFVILFSVLIVIKSI